ncbi:T9SS type A sorting domain-containing protein [Gracilimonas sp. BCB1]|uniref:T9SS type A sorting domain-containing protein n=1 Tax=Gracilimonas sp. BCB1 TaxID=3152362 RepID=UPI0032D979D9
MKKYLLILSFALFGSSLSFGQTTIEEQYFHELKGMEDSSGVTHLFYRQYVASTFQCSEGNGGHLVDNRSNDIRHFNTENKSDSLKFRDGWSEWCIDGYYDGMHTVSYTFFDNDPDKWIVQGGYQCYRGISDYKKNYFSLLYGCVIKQRPKSISIKNSESGLILSPNQDSVYIDFSSYLTIPLSTSPENWPKISENDHEGFEHFLDSVGVKWNILSIHPKIDSLYFGKGGSGHLFRSTNYTGNFKLADSSGSHTKLAFDADSSTIYSLVTVSQNSEFKRKLLISRNLGVEDSWSQLSIPETETRFEFITTDRVVPNQVLLADSNIVYLSDNAWESFNVVYNSEDAITGLYKKPNSNMLYVLTRKELLEVNTKTKSVTSLKQIPVSNEENPTDIPKQVSLNQNYPNPFNPSTMIRYQLAENSLVRLEVFDVTGRRVAVLVNGERKAAGSHQVTFGAGNLASGVYFYRLETAGQTLTQKMLLVK